MPDIAFNSVGCVVNEKSLEDIIGSLQRFAALLLRLQKEGYVLEGGKVDPEGTFRLRAQREQTYY